MLVDWSPGIFLDLSFKTEDDYVKYGYQHTRDKSEYHRKW